MSAYIICTVNKLVIFANIDFIEFHIFLFQLPKPYFLLGSNLKKKLRKKRQTGDKQETERETEEICFFKDKGESERDEEKEEREKRERETKGLQAETVYSQKRKKVHSFFLLSLSSSKQAFSSLPLPRKEAKEREIFSNSTLLSLSLFISLC